MRWRNSGDHNSQGRTLLINHVFGSHCEMKGSELRRILTAVDRRADDQRAILGAGTGPGRSAVAMCGALRMMVATVFGCTAAVHLLIGENKRL